MYPLDTRKKAFILELKASKKVRELEKDAKEAVQQIVDQDYAEGLFELGFTDVEMYGIAFYRKTCRVYYGGKVE